MPERIGETAATVVMGGLVLDLEAAALDVRPATLDVGIIGGGVLLSVPDWWRVDIFIRPFMGGVPHA